VAARLLRHHLDRPALLFQLRADPDHAHRSGGAEAGRQQVYRTQGAVLFPLGRGLHRPDGLIVAYLYGEEKALLLNDPNNRLIGIGMWLALIMAFNVWFVIWPNQKRALGIVEADDAAKAKSARPR
jgi:hypothetical protein